MPFYMSQVTYTPGAMKAMVENPQDRVAVIRKMQEAAGCRLLHFFYAFGEYDVVAISEGPDNTAVASLLLALAAGGAVARMKTTVLMTPEEGQEAFRRAGGVLYAPPAG